MGEFMNSAAAVEGKIFSLPVKMSTVQNRHYCIIKNRCYSFYKVSAACLILEKLKCVKFRLMVYTLNIFEADLGLYLYVCCKVKLARCAKLKIRPKDTTSWFPKSNLKCWLVRPQDTFTFCQSISEEFRHEQSQRRFLMLLINGFLFARQSFNLHL